EVVPELPEVETIRRQLEPEVAGRRVERLEIPDPKWSEPAAPYALIEAVSGRLIEGLERRGKYLLLRLEGDRFLVMHLRMTGNLLLVERAADRADPGERLPGDARLHRPAEEERYLRARLRLEDGRELWFTDPRRFGRGFLADGEALKGYFAARLGVE